MSSATTPRCIRNLARAARDLPAVRCEDCSGLGVCPGVVVGGRFAGGGKGGGGGGGVGRGDGDQPMIDVPDRCPHCGAAVRTRTRSSIMTTCGRAWSRREGWNPQPWDCIRRENETLRAQLGELRRRLSQAERADCAEMAKGKP